MEPWFWRLGAGISALGACAIAPFLASGLILFSLDLPLSELTPGLWRDYWQVLDQPAYRPYALRIRCWGSTGLILPPLLWCGAMLWSWRRRQSSPYASPYLPFDDLSSSTLELPTATPGAIAVTMRRGRTRAAPDGHSVLVSVPFYPEALAVVVETLKHSTGATLVVDSGGRSGAYARASHGKALLRLGPFGGGAAWNPLAGAWGSEGLDRDELRQLAAVWLPDAGKRDRFVASHARNAFISLVHVVDDVVRGTSGTPVPVTPGDLYRLCAQARSYRSTRAFLLSLAGKPGIGPHAHRGLGEWSALGDKGIDTVWKRLTYALAPFADPAVDAATRGRALGGGSLQRTDVYLDIPDRWRMASGPLIDSAIRQWQSAVRVDASSLLVVHALDTFPPIAALTDHKNAWRCLATARGIAALHATYGNRATALDRRFGLCVIHAPRDEAFARDESEALKVLIASQRNNRHLVSAPTSPTGWMSLRRGEQIVSTASLTKPIICRTLNLPRKPNAAPPHADHGEAMPIPTPFVAFLATLVATSGRASDVAPFEVPATVAPLSAETAPLVEATFGPHRFRFPKNMYYQQSGPDPDGGVMLSVQWPSLQPLPQGQNYRHTTEHFLSHVSIDLAYPSRLTDAKYRRRLRRSIEPFDLKDKTRLANPAENLSLRIKSDQVFGLVPYLVDFDALKPYFEKRYGPGTRAWEPAGNDDWYLRPDDDTAAPLTVISCTSRLIPDGAKVENGRVKDDETIDRRATCTHEFLVPEYKLVVRMNYMRVILPDWERIERHVRELLTKAEVR